MPGGDIAFERSDHFGSMNLGLLRFVRFVPFASNALERHARRLDVLLDTKLLHHRRIVAVGKKPSGVVALLADFDQGDQGVGPLRDTFASRRIRNPSPELAALGRHEQVKLVRVCQLVSFGAGLGCP